MVVNPKGKKILKAKWGLSRLEEMDSRAAEL